jgi:cell division protein FtsN
MTKKARFFIYDRKEVAILVLLAVMVAAFAFTLGVHLGKRAGGKNLVTSSTENDHKSDLEPAKAAIPTDEELQARIRAQPPATTDLLNQATHEEVARTGIKLDSSHQVTLPQAREASAPEVSKPSQGSGKKYAIQIGSYPSAIMAQVKVHELEDLGLKPSILKVDVKGLGVRFRVLVGSFKTRHAAEKAGEIYRSEKKFDTFIIAPIQG